MTRLSERLIEAFTGQGMGSGRLAARIAYDAILEHRDECFTPGNDKVWGEGLWERCEICLDALGLPSYHSKGQHDT